ncbi:hypothetical protein P168DRAFT_293951 [Aspergillus campestris IBT 28561]|uniref:Peptidase C2 calpain domain-containing protein n=1 Tax=Aspergillus campestris (strain IBT 28561) TaxID=1392248 RepID=A0A2I1CQ16_ASPC2|nr:uncharacterized protein P168DRAFT_293951 [Aspergillus campestris IBT 28561]PKX99720.1 hypothetical protein P168DRAFT_293951 [Aspergillus campestris IBT 28561]
MDCDKVLQNFENLYLNWNPGLFRYREDIHFPWDLTSGRGVAGCFVKNPQFSVSTRGGHHGDGDDAPDGAVEHEEPGFISIYIFNTEGKRVSLSDGALHRGPYVDSPNTLMRLEMHPNTTYTAVISEQSLPSLNQNFTLSALSTAPVQIAPAQNKYKYVTKVQGHGLNPQFTMKVSSATDVSLLLECPETETATHIKLFWSNGNRVARVRSRDIITDSGDYRRGGCLAEKRTLDEGIYTIVCSTFAPDQLGRFTLWISSSYPCKVDPLAPEAAGRRASISDIGILPPGSDRMLAPLRVPRLTRIKLIARSRQSLIGNHPLGRRRSEDGHHSDAISGVRVSDFDLQSGLENQGGVWIVLERIGGPGGQVEDHFEVEALSEERVDIGEWIVEDA